MNTNPSLSKAQEIEILRATVAKLLQGGSYTGEWLRDQLGSLESAIRSDSNPDIYASSYSEFATYREQQAAAAKAEAAAIIEEAKAEAARIVAAGERQRDNAARAIRQALQTAGLL